MGIARRTSAVVGAGLFGVSVMAATATAAHADEFWGQYFPSIAGITSNQDDRATGYNGYRVRCFGNPGSTTLLSWQRDGTTFMGPSTRSITADGYLDSSVGGVYTLDEINFVSRQQSGSINSCTLYGL